MKIVAWGVTDTGNKREHNEDALLMAPEIGLFGVADGMGGHAAGDRASRMAVTVVEEEIRTAELEGRPVLRGAIDEEPGKRLAEAARTASHQIHDVAQDDPAAAGMGTTLTSILVYRGRVYLAHVGDSRCYLYRDGRIEQLTVDHSWIEEQVRAGFMTRDEAEQSALRHVVTRSVGFEREVDVDMMTMPALMGDCFLLCSDGLSNYLGSERLRDFLTRGYYSEVPRRLVDTANALGARTISRWWWSTWLTTAAELPIAFAVDQRVGQLLDIGVVLLLVPLYVHHGGVAGFAEVAVRLLKHQQTGVVHSNVATRGHGQKGVAGCVEYVSSVHRHDANGLGRPRNELNHEHVAVGKRLAHHPRPRLFGCRANGGELLRLGIAGIEGQGDELHPSLAGFQRQQSIPHEMGRRKGHGQVGGVGRCVDEQSGDGGRSRVEGVIAGDGMTIGGARGCA